jgi:hypothetical protein
MNFLFDPTAVAVFRAEEYLKCAERPWKLAC